MDNAEAESLTLPIRTQDEQMEVDREKRIAWWREAKMGLFIHWGLYSLPGGVWKDSEVKAAYAEHLQLRAQIPVSEYADIAKAFNPIQFDAQKWVRYAKEAGMKYIIITAKHHEGFAMYDSKVSDYNIVQATPFHRDPLAELVIACREEGIVPCFYYSHAMDWHHPDSQGNTLDFPENIGAYDSLESWVNDEDKRTRYERYLTEKAFPQIKELLTQYGPIGIIWFDCGHKVTDEQGKQFVDGVHDLQPDCLVNSRVRREGFGDYLNSGDNQLYFRGAQKDWESIATLNHSWGYNQMDQNWKSARDILHDMINVVSMNGNYVMNVGPMGDGKFDHTSIQLLEEVGRWMKLNGESIYGTIGSPIGKMPWGRCTMKGRRLFLHVWDWPVHGKLVLPGIQNTIERAYLLADSEKAQLPFHRLNEYGDTSISIPLEPLDPICTVIAVEFEGAIRANPLRVLFSDGVSNVFGVFDGKLHGPSLRYDTGKKGRDNVKNWHHLEDGITWDFRVATPGIYQVIVAYGAAELSAGGSFEVSIGEARRTATVMNTGGEYLFQAFELGQIELSQSGEYELSVKANHICGDVLMNVKEITLVSQGDLSAAANLALRCHVTASSESAANSASHAVDGNPLTYWQPTRKDRADDNEVSLTVDLGREELINKAVLTMAAGFVHGYNLLYSLEGDVWHQAFQRDSSKGDVTSTETALFPRMKARYVTLDVQIFDPERDFQLNGFEIFNESTIPSGPILDRVFFSDSSSGTEQQETTTMSLPVGSSVPLALKGNFTDGVEADLKVTFVSITSSDTNVASIDEQGIITARNTGIARIEGRANLHGVIQKTSFFVDVWDPTYCVADLWLEHPTLVQQIGHAAELQIGDVFPALYMLPHGALAAKFILVNVTTSDIIMEKVEEQLDTEKEVVIDCPDPIKIPGQYQLQVELIGLTPGVPSHYDAFYFRVVDPSVSKEGQSQIAYLGEDGKLQYVPDFKGNRIADFSHCGYQGGGVQLPNVPVVIRLEPTVGDQTAHIQDAIDLVSAMPQSVDGMRGAILLSKGTYEVSGTLRIGSSGVVLRGEGSHEGGTLIQGTGRAQRNILEISGAAGPQWVKESKTAILDWYVPSGADSFHVEDASCYQVGDKVKVIRHGNERWIHAIGMDSIRSRPVAGGTQPWPAFDLIFDRIITKMNGNCMTLDAPITNVIERHWGGGTVFRYEDPDRIEQVGVEEIRIATEYDPSVTETRIDGNEGSTPYLADEQHAISFICLDHVINAWVRDIQGYHMQHALVEVRQGAKWITVQDCAANEFISVITGGRRYAYHLKGELTLVQRVYAAKARHAFAVDARVTGPNVFLACESALDYNTSEPHHRWSVGCLYDNVKARIHIQDRGWLGSGHGWAGANYVCWNTENELVVQQPPTAMNYAIGHVGTRGVPFLPNAYDSRLRNEGHWESLGVHVEPDSLYLQQLQDRLGPEAVRHIAKRLES